MTDGESQSAIDLRCKNARDPKKALHLNQTRMPCTGCCFSHHCMLAVIMPECSGGVAPPEFIRLLDHSENRAWTWPCELDSRCLSGGTCHPNRIIVSPHPPICHSTLYSQSLMVGNPCGAKWPGNRCAPIFHLRQSTGTAFFRFRRCGLQRVMGWGLGQWSSRSTEWMDEVIPTGVLLAALIAGK